MSQKHTIALIFAIGLAFLATIIAHMLFQRTVSKPVPVVEIEKPKEVDTAEVLVTTQSLTMGMPITADLITWQKWPLQGLHNSYLVRNEDNQDKYQHLIGGLVKRPINQGEPITMDDIIRKGDRSFLAAIVRPGMRAVSVPLGNMNGVLISPGDWVDIISADMHPKNKSQENLSGKTLAYNIKVLAVDQFMDETGHEKEMTQPKSVTLEVSPEQAEILSIALKLGNLIFSVRGLQQDNQENQVPNIDLSALKNQLKNQLEKSDEDEPEVKPSKNDITIVRGTKAEKINL